MNAAIERLRTLRAEYLRAGKLQKADAIERAIRVLQEIA